ncbi:MAG: hypothetical protein JKX73_11660 [Flavobacteriales bacterium]|nr:hypothetical protein [Flavobacteriales bacterium]
MNRIFNIYKPLGSYCNVAIAGGEVIKPLISYQKSYNHQVKLEGINQGGDLLVKVKEEPVGYSAKLLAKENKLTDIVLNL